MSYDPERIIRKTVSLPAWIWDEIERYRSREGAVTLADAVRRLLVDALSRARSKRERKDG